LRVELKDPKAEGTREYTRVLHDYTPKAKSVKLNSGKWSG